MYNWIAHLKRRWIICFYSFRNDPLGDHWDFVYRILSAMPCCLHHLEVSCFLYTSIMHTAYCDILDSFFCIKILSNSVVFWCYLYVCIFYYLNHSIQCLYYRQGKTSSTPSAEEHNMVEQPKYYEIGPIQQSI